jgi:hypothetical protein
MTECKQCNFEGETTRTAKALKCLVCGELINVSGHGKPQIIDGVCLNCLRKYRENPEKFVKEHKRR